jgi:hypothetical protein
MLGVQRAILTAILLLTLARPAAALDDRSQAADDVSADVAVAWFTLLYDIVKTERTAPPEASRIYGIAAVALYEAIVGGTREHRSLAGQLNGLTPAPAPDPGTVYHWPSVANAVLANTLRTLYAAGSANTRAGINALDRRFESEYRRRLHGPDHDRSIALGRTTAGAMLMWAATDGSVIHRSCRYAAAATAGGWRPTWPRFEARPHQPCWGEIRPMALRSADTCAAPGPPRFSEHTASSFHAAAGEVYRVGMALTENQKAIARYWADNPGDTGTPAGHWIDIVSQIVRKDRLSLAKAAEAYARVGVAVHDAFVICWKTKYVYNLRRPVTYINDNLDGEWKPYVVTPNFPSYPSGHSVQSGAVARVLTDMFGARRFVDTTHADHGFVPPQPPRTFKSFDEAAAEAAVSRLYGGIHFAFDNEHGLTSGSCIGQAILDIVRFGRR